MSVEALERAIEEDSPAKLDEYLASLPDGTRRDMNDMCGCFLHERWKGLVPPGRGLQIRYWAVSVGEPTESGDLLRTVEANVELPSWLALWQMRCTELREPEVDEDERERHYVAVEEARAVLERVAKERETWT